MCALLGLTEDDLADPRFVDRSAKPGDQVACRIGDTPLWHHGIFIGDVDGLELVVEMPGMPSDNSKAADTPAIAVRPIKRYGDYLVVEYTEDALNTPEAKQQSVDRAITALKAVENDPSLVTYDPVTFNCETLAIACRTGRWAPPMGERMHDALERVSVETRIGPKCQAYIHIVLPDVPSPQAAAINPSDAHRASTKSCHSGPPGPAGYRNFLG